MVDLVPSAEQAQIRDSVRAFLDERAPLLRLIGGSPGADLALWREIGALGWFGLGLDEDDGGIGLGVSEEMLVAAECGRALLSPAFVGTVMGAHLAAAKGKGGLVGEIVSGALPVGIAAVRIAGPREPAAPAQIMLFDTPEGSPFCLWSPYGIALYPWSVLSDVRSVTPLDETLATAVATLDVTGAISSSHVAAVPAHADVLIAAMLAGLAERATEEAVSYAQMREQFGQPIGGFQAIKHHCADMAMRQSAANAQALFAALALDGDLAMIGSEASSARVVAADAAISNAAMAVQIHGGIGYTADCVAQALVKRSQLLSRIGGDVRVHERRLMEG